MTYDDPTRWETVTDEGGNSERYYLDETFRPTQEYLDYLDGLQEERPDNRWHGQADGPAGSLDTDSETHKNLLWSYTPDDPNTYTYDPDGIYNPATIGIYPPLPIDPDKIVDPDQIAAQITVLKQALSDFLPAQVNLFIPLTLIFNGTVPQEPPYEMFVPEAPAGDFPDKHWLNMVLDKQYFQKGNINNNTITNVNLGKEEPAAGEITVCRNGCIAFSAANAGQAFSIPYAYVRNHEKDGRGQKDG